MLWGKVLRSPFPHARIVHIDTSRAWQLPGVRAVLTGPDLAGMLVGRTLRDVPLLAQEKVRFVGEKVAAVATDDVDTAEEALTLIDVDYAELPAVFDPVEAMQPGAPVVHEGSPSYEGPSGPVQPQGNIGHHITWSGGDVEQGFRESALLFEHTFTTPWVHQGSMEPYACMVDIDEAGRIQVWANNKQPFRLRWQLARALGLPEDWIRINPCAIGGDFGGKAGAMDVPLAYALAPRSGRPVKMLMTYIEELMAGNPRHPAVITIKSGVKQDGRLWARRTRVVYNGGAYGGFQRRADAERRSPGEWGALSHPPLSDRYLHDVHPQRPLWLVSGSRRTPGGVCRGVAHRHDCPGHGERPVCVPSAERRPGGGRLWHRPGVPACAG
jgi:carbon-monoxide dehydrogenase large subunit